MNIIGENGKKLCARCGSDQDVQQHHWAPSALFDDADFWPKSELCQRCHVLWHSIVTPEPVTNDEESFDKAEVVAAAEKYERFEIMWLDIIDIETLDKPRIIEFFGKCADKFTKPRVGYLKLGWKLFGLYESDGVSRRFLFKPVEKN